MPERLTLFDIESRTAILRLGDVEIEYHGLTGRAILSMMHRWDEVQKFLVGLTLSTAEALKAAPGVAEAIVANGTMPFGSPPEVIQRAERAAANLPASIQLDLVTVIWNATFTEGFGPFMARMRGIAGAASVGDSKAVDTKSRRQSRSTSTSTQAAPPDPASTSPPEPSEPGTSSPAAAASAK